MRRLPRPRRAVSALILLAVLAGWTASRSPGASQVLDLGDEHSWIRIQNVGSEPAAIQLDYYDLGGTRITGEACPASGACTALQPGFGWSFFQQLNGALPDPYRGSAFVTVDQPFVALLARDVLRTDGTFQIAGDTLRLGRPTALNHAPLVQSTATHVSRLSVQNTSETLSACVELRFYQEGALAPAAIDPPGPTPGCPQGGHLLSPRATLLRDERTLTVPAGFDGAASIVTRTTGSGTVAAAQTVSAVVDTRVRNGPGLASYRGFSADEASRVVVLPLVDRNATEGQSRWTTRFRIFSADPTVPNEVSLRFAGHDGAGETIEIEHSVTVRSSLTCDQARGGAAGCLPDGVDLPATFFGTVRMQAAEPVTVVTQRISPDGSLADYRGFTGQEASGQIVLPVVNKNYGPFGGSRGWNSWFRVLTYDGSIAHVHVAYYSRQFPLGLVGSGVTVDGQRTFRQWEDRRLPDGWVGSAVVVSDRPVVVIANLESDVFEGDPVMLYNGVSLE